MLSINNFKNPEQHPYGMLEGYEHAYEKESVLAYILIECIQVRDWIAVKTIYSHPTMVQEGLLEMVGINQYLLTEKSKELLYSVYHN